MKFQSLKKFETPHDYRVRLSKEELDLFKKYKVRKILEICCGNGNNLIALSRLGYNLAGIESDKNLLKEAKGNISKSGQVIKIGAHSIYEKKLPFKDGEFDCVYSWQYLNHNFKNKIEGVFKEISRVLKKGGIFSIKISDAEQFNFKHVKNDIYKECDPEFPSIEYKKIAEQTFIKLETEEKGIPHYGFYKKELIQSLRGVGFSIINSRKIRWNIVVNCKK